MVYLLQSYGQHAIALLLAQLCMKTLRGGKIESKPDLKLRMRISIRGHNGAHLKIRGDSEEKKLRNRGSN